MAKKKNAPVLKNNLRNTPAEKFRTVNRMNGIVTMVEYTGEDDIKAYELKPTYRELGGGGGSSIPMMHMTVKNSTSSHVLLQFDPGMFVKNDIGYFTDVVDTNEEKTLNLFYIQPGYPLEDDVRACSFWEFSNNDVFTDAENCTYIPSTEQTAARIEIIDPSKDSSITLTLND